MIESPHVFERAGPILPRLEVEGDRGSAGWHEVDRAVQHAVVGRRGAGQKHAARQAGDGAFHEIARQTCDAGLPIDPRSAPLELLERPAGA